MKSKILLILVFMTVTGFAQVPEIVWQQCYNYSGAQEGDKIPGILPEGDGYLVLFEVWGNENLPNFHGSFDIMVVETDSIGNVLREKCYGGTGQDIPCKIIDAGNGTYYVLGRTNSTDGDVQSGNYGGSDIWVFKINGNGELLWERTYGSTGYDRAKDLIILPDGSFLIAGEISSDSGDIGTYYGGWDIWLCRCDSVGNILYETTLGNEGEDAVNGVLLNSEGNIILTGSIEEQGGTITCEPRRLKDVWLTELDVQLNILWDHCYGGSWDDVGYTITEHEDGYLVLSSSKSNDGDVSGHHGGSYSFDIWFFLVDNFQNIVWQKSLGGTFEEVPSSLIVDEEGDYITVFGHSNSNDGDVLGNHQSAGTTSDIWVVQMSLEGEIQWQQCYGGIGNEILASSYSVIKNENHSFIVAAQTDVSVSDDVRCSFYENTKSAWIIEIEMCPGYFPETPETPSGPDTICTQNQQEHTYTIPPPANAWTFEWSLEPDTAGTLTNYGLYAVAHWDPVYEGTAAVSARCANYCTESAWSEPKYTEVQTCLGTEETPAENTALKVYPNPAKDYVVFELNINAPTEIIIYDAFGREVSCLPVAQKKTVWLTKNMRNGLYYYKTKINGKALSGKVVIRD
ncbi:MAG: hypothetical protein DRI87_05310 [Bacteroidetes bacterium]|nr:MAG: hypothetical protein DRI87_05310 [Bacteroidota bacterium]